MKRFQFRLQRLARVRHVQEEIARARWLCAERIAREAERRLASADQELEEARDDLRTCQARPHIEPREVLDIGGTIDLMRQGRERLHLLARASRDEAERERTPWQAARAEVEGLSRLEQRARTTHRLEGESKEAKELDEIARDRRRRADPFNRPNH